MNKRLFEKEREVKSLLQGFSANRLVLCLDSTESTNIIAREFLTKGKAFDLEYKKDAPPLIIAAEQTMGEGRLGRCFESKRDMGLYMTAVYPLTGHEQYLSLLTLLAGLSSVKAAEKTVNSKGQKINLTLKWPNDIYFDGKKLGGIIVKMINYPNIAAIVGIGINLNQSGEDFPSEIADRAVSFKMAGIDISSSELAAEIINTLDKAVYEDKSLTSPAPEILNELNNKSFTLGKRVSFTIDGKELVGTAEEILKNGALAVKTDDGRLYEVISGEAGFAV
ncbi:MAG TPA: biotin--[acetyl-CoA-carboxylase] ligase [Clostridiales bacterium]|jgi:BirA family biotin operon repressor/biotin-[acetyl-CoA-carboxylase] ligase|nr:biotin--[acetyl-CoA-carboxylase] ligase [Clostridiales bacterium]HPU67964.1 biotin--[acetyl-CoA-carboxylase] ligase [Clostridiales bacterium]HQA05348.1 biotin--[acetyl-CoA-carboxylase] ligase [Clostridiales bacterium]HXK83823.1 biotin--[acetyl-CoA-carboxylase] ligase [Clostridiales bacterium]